MPLPPKPWIIDPRMVGHFNRLLHNDLVTIGRPGTTADAEGDSSGVRSSVTTTLRGTLGAVSATESLTAAERDTVINRSLTVELGTDVHEGDWVTGAGVTYEVVSAEDRRFYRRCLMRAIN